VGIASTYITTMVQTIAARARRMEQEKEACEEPSWHAARMEQSQQLHLEHMKLFSDGARYGGCCRSVSPSNFFSSLHNRA
jgi:hypothetical protein